MLNLWALMRSAFSLFPFTPNEEPLFQKRDTLISLINHKCSSLIFLSKLTFSQDSPPLTLENEASSHFKHIFSFLEHVASFLEWWALFLITMGWLIMGVCCKTSFVLFFSCYLHRFCWDGVVVKGSPILLSSRLLFSFFSSKT